MKNLVNISVILGFCFMIAVLLYGCDISIGAIRGKGELKANDFSVGEYTDVEISGGMEIIYTNEDSDTLTIEIQDNLLEYLVVEERNGVLKIWTKKTFVFDFGKTPKVYISTPNFERLKVSGTIIFNKSDNITSDTFTLSISGACKVNIPLEVRKLDINTSGAADVTLSGKATEASITSSGTSSIDASDLQTTEAKIKLSGACTATIDCSDSLNASISGTGSIRYTGNPSVSQTIAGAGSIKRAD